MQADLNEQIKARIQERLAERANPQPVEPIKSAEPSKGFNLPSLPSLDLPKWAIPSLLLTGLVGGFSLSALNTVLSKNPDLVKHESTMRALEAQQEANAIATTEAIKEAGTDICVGLCPREGDETTEPEPSPSPSPVAEVEAEPLVLTPSPSPSPVQEWNTALYQNWMVYYLAQIPVNWEQWVQFRKTVTPASFSEPEQERAFYDAWDRVRVEQWGDWIEWCAKNSNGLAPGSTEQDRQICNSLNL